MSLVIDAYFDVHILKIYEKKEGKDNLYKISTDKDCPRTIVTNNE